MGYNNDNLAYKSLTDKIKASEEECKRLENKEKELREEREKIRFSVNRHRFIKKFCYDHLTRLGVEFIQSNFRDLSTTNNRNSGWLYKLKAEPVDTKFGKMYIGLLVCIPSDRYDENYAMFQECLIKIDENKKEEPITKVGLGMWHLWDGKCFKEIDDCPLGRREIYSEQDFDEFVKKTFLGEYIKV